MERAFSACNMLSWMLITITSTATPTLMDLRDTFLCTPITYLSFLAALEDKNMLNQSNERILSIGVIIDDPFSDYIELQIRDRGR